MPIWKKSISLDELNKRSQNTMASWLDITFEEIGDDFLISKMPFSTKIIQPIGIMHGGASCVLAETVGSTAANYCVDDAAYCVGLAINTNHIRSIKSSWVLAKASPFHLGKSTQVWHIKISNPDKQTISMTQLTMAILKK